MRFHRLRESFRTYRARRKAGFAMASVSSLPARDANRGRGIVQSPIPAPRAVLRAVKTSWRRADVHQCSRGRLPNRRFAVSTSFGVLPRSFASRARGRWLRNRKGTISHDSFRLPHGDFTDDERVTQDIPRHERASRQFAHQSCRQVVSIQTETVDPGSTGQIDRTAWTGRCGWVATTERARRLVPPPAFDQRTERFADKAQILSRKGAERSSGLCDERRHREQWWYASFNPFGTIKHQMMIKSMLVAARKKGRDRSPAPFLSFGNRGER